MQSINTIIQVLENDFTLSKDNGNEKETSEPAMVKLQGPLVDGKKNIWQVIIVDEYDRLINRYTTSNYLKAILLFGSIASDRSLDTVEIIS